MGKLKKEWQHFKQHKELIVMSIPAILFKMLFNYLPMLGLVLAFKKYRYDLGIWGSPWVGLENFKFFFNSSSAFVVTRNTILYNLSFIIITLVVSVTLAILLNEISGRWVKAHQTVLFMPYFISWVVVGYMVNALLDNKNGFVNGLIEWFGVSGIRWYESPEYWPIIMILTQLWKVLGFSTLIYYAGILGIDASYYEAAKIDGATKWQIIRKITLPMLYPFMLILFIVDLGKIFRADFGLFFFVPNDISFLYNATDVIDTYVYRSLRVVGDIGMSTAVGFYQSLVGFVLVMLANYTIKKINKENALW